MSHSVFLWKCVIAGTLATLVGVCFLGAMLFTGDWTAWPALLIFFGAGARLL